MIELLLSTPNGRAAAAAMDNDGDTAENDARRKGFRDTADLIRRALQQQSVRRQQQQVAVPPRPGPCGTMWHHHAIGWLTGVEAVARPVQQPLQPPQPTITTTVTTLAFSGGGEARAAADRTQVPRSCDCTTLTH
jgi:hypothetical protein